MNYKNFASIVHLYQYLGEVIDNFDYAKSCFLPPYSFMTKDGIHYPCYSFNSLLVTLNHIADTKFDPLKSTEAQPTHLLFETDKPYHSDHLCVAGIKVKSYKFENVDIKVGDALLEEDIEAVKEVEEKPQVDWKYVDEMKASEPKGDKKALHDYALTFDIKLKSNKTFLNMLRDFKLAIGV